MGNWLRVHLRGAARSVIITNDETYSILVDRLTARFGGELMKRQYEQRLPSRRRRPGESLNQLSDDIRKMCDVVYSELPAATKEKMIVKHFEMALNDPAAQYELSRAGLTTLEQALQFAINRESFIGSNNQPRAHSNYINPTDSSPQQQSSVQNIMSTLLTEVKKIADNRSTPPSSTSYRNTTQPRPCAVCGSDHPIYMCRPCRFCGGQHYNNNCPTRPNQQGNDQVPLRSSSN